jgi:hypothetical protein
MPIHNIPETEIVGPGRAARENLSREYSVLLLRYAEGDRLDDEERRFLKGAEELLDEFSYVFGDDEAMWKQSEYSLLRSLLYSDRLHALSHLAILQAMPDLLGAPEKALERIIGYHKIIADISAQEPSDPFRAKELGRVLEAYSKNIG